VYLASFDSHTILISHRPPYDIRLSHPLNTISTHLNPLLTPPKPPKVHLLLSTGGLRQRRADRQVRERLLGRGPDGPPAPHRAAAPWRLHRGGGGELGGNGGGDHDGISADGHHPQLGQLPHHYPRAAEALLW